MALVNFYESSFTEVSDTQKVRAGSNLKNIIKKYIHKLPEQQVVEVYIPDEDKTEFVPLETESYKVIITVNGKENDQDYIIKKDDVIDVIYLPQSDNKGMAVGIGVAGVALLTLGAAAGVAGVVLAAKASTLLTLGWSSTAVAGTIGAASATWMVVGTMAGAAGAAMAIAGFGSLDSINNKSTKSSKEAESLYGVNGGSNESIIGHKYPLVMGTHLVNPYMIGSPYHVTFNRDGNVNDEDATSTDAVNTLMNSPSSSRYEVTDKFDYEKDHDDMGQYYQALYCVGYGPLKLTDFKLGNVKLAYNKAWSGDPDRKTVLHGVLKGTSTDDETDDGDILKKWKNNDVTLEILQAGNQLTDGNSGKWGTIYPVTCQEDTIGAKVLFAKDALLGSSSKLNYMGEGLENGYRTNTVRCSKDCPTRIEVELDAPQGLYATRTVKASDKSESVDKYYDIPLNVAVQWRYSKEGQASSDAESPDGWNSFDYEVMLNDKGEIVNKEPVEYTNTIRNAEVFCNYGLTDRSKSESESYNDYWLGTKVFQLNAKTIGNNPDKKSLSTEEINGYIQRGLLKVTQKTYKLLTKEKRNIRVGTHKEVEYKTENHWVSDGFVSYTYYKKLWDGVGPLQILGKGWFKIEKNNKNFCVHNGIYCQGSEEKDKEKYGNYFTNFLNINAKHEVSSTIKFKKHLWDSWSDATEQQIGWLKGWYKSESKTYHILKKEDVSVKHTKTIVDYETRDVYVYHGHDITVNEYSVTPGYESQLEVISTKTTFNYYSGNLTPDQVWNPTEGIVFSDLSNENIVADYEGITGCEVFSLTDHYDGFEAHDKDSFNLNEKRFVFSKTFTPAEMQKLCDFDIQKSDCYGNIQVRVIRLTPAYIKESGNETKLVTAMNYEDLIQWNYLRTWQFDKTAFEEKYGSAAAITDEMNPADFPLRPIPEEDLNKFCYIALRLKQDKAETAGSSLDQLNCIAQAFVPKFDLLNRKWVPFESDDGSICETQIAQKYKYWHITFDSKGKKKIEEVDEVTYSFNTDPYYYYKTRSGTDFLDTIKSDIFGGSGANVSTSVYPFDKNTRFISSYTWQMHDYMTYKYMSNNTAAQSILSLVGSHLKNYSKNYDGIEIDRFGDFYEFCNDVVDGTAQSFTAPSAYTEETLERYNTFATLFKTKWDAETSNAFINAKEILTNAPANAVWTGCYDYIFEYFLYKWNIGFKYQYLEFARYYIIKNNLCTDSDSKRHVQYNCNGILNSDTKLETFFYNILVTGRAFFKRSDNNKYEPLIGRPNDYPVTVINQRNCISLSNSRSFDEPISGYLINYTDENDNYETNTIYVMDDGEDKKNPSHRIDNFSIPYVTNVYQLNSLARFNLATVLYQKETYQRTVGQIGHSITLGDLVLLQDDSLLVGEGSGARIKKVLRDDTKSTGTIIGFVTDNTFTNDGETNFGCTIVQPTKMGVSRTFTAKLTTPTSSVRVAYRFLDKSEYDENKIYYTYDPSTDTFTETEVTEEDAGTTNLYYDVESITIIKGETNIGIFEDTFRNGYVYGNGEVFIQAGQLITFGIVGQMTQAALVMGIKPKSKDQFELTLVPYNEELYNYGDKFPYWKADITVPEREDTAFKLTSVPTIAETKATQAETLNSALEAVEELEAETIDPEPPTITSFKVVADNKDNLKMTVYTGSGVFNVITNYHYQITRGEDFKYGHAPEFVEAQVYYVYNSKTKTYSKADPQPRIDYIHPSDAYDDKQKYYKRNEKGEYVVDTTAKPKYVVSTEYDASEVYYKKDGNNYVEVTITPNYQATEEFDEDTTYYLRNAVYNKATEYDSDTQYFVKVARYEQALVYDASATYYINTENGFILADPQPTSASFYNRTYYTFKEYAYSKSGPTESEFSSGEYYTRVLAEGYTKEYEKLDSTSFQYQDYYIETVTNSGSYYIYTFKGSDYYIQAPNFNDSDFGDNGKYYLQEVLTVWKDISVVNNVYTLDRSTDGYPEVSTLKKWKIRCSVTNTYGETSEWVESDIATEGYKSWILPANKVVPSFVADANGYSFSYTITDVDNYYGSYLPNFMYCIGDNFTRALSHTSYDTYYVIVPGETTYAIAEDYDAQITSYYVKSGDTYIEANPQPDINNYLEKTYYIRNTKYEIAAVQPTTDAEVQAKEYYIFDWKELKEKSNYINFDSSKYYEKDEVEDLHLLVRTYNEITDKETDYQVIQNFLVNVDAYKGWRMPISNLSASFKAQQTGYDFSYTLSRSSDYYGSFTPVIRYSIYNDFVATKTYKSYEAYYSKTVDEYQVTEEYNPQLGIYDADHNKVDVSYDEFLKGTYYKHVEKWVVATPTQEEVMAGGYYIHNWHTAVNSSLFINFNTGRYLESEDADELYILFSVRNEIANYASKPAYFKPVVDMTSYKNWIMPNGKASVSFKSGETGYTFSYELADYPNNYFGNIYPLIKYAINDDYVKATLYKSYEKYYEKDSAKYVLTDEFDSQITYYKKSGDDYIAVDPQPDYSNFAEDTYYKYVEEYTLADKAPTSQADIDNGEFYIFNWRLASNASGFIKLDSLNNIHKKYFEPDEVKNLHVMIAVENETSGYVTMPEVLDNVNLDSSDSKSWRMPVANSDFNFAAEEIAYSYKYAFKNPSNYSGSIVPYIKYAIADDYTKATLYKGYEDYYYLKGIKYVATDKFDTQYKYYKKEGDKYVEADPTAETFIDGAYYRYEEEYELAVPRPDSQADIDKGIYYTHNWHNVTNTSNYLYYNSGRYYERSDISKLYILLALRNETSGYMTIPTIPAELTISTSGYKTWWIDTNDFSNSFKAEKERIVITTRFTASTYYFGNYSILYDYRYKNDFNKATEYNPRETYFKKGDPTYTRGTLFKADATYYVQVGDEYEIADPQPNEFTFWSGTYYEQQQNYIEAEIQPTSQEEIDANEFWIYKWTSVEDTTNIIFGDNRIEADDIKKMMIRFRVKNNTSDNCSAALIYKGTEIDTDSYGTWIIQTPYVYVRVSDRTVSLVMSQPATSGDKEVYGDMKYKVQIMREDDSQYYAPNIEANPYTSEQNYKNEESENPYVTSGSTYIQVMPLKGQENIYTQKLYIPDDWKTTFEQYYKLENGTYVKYSPIYNILTEEPSDWSTNYDVYYYMKSESGVSKITRVSRQYAVLTEKPSDWDTAYYNYYYRDDYKHTNASEGYYNISSKVEFSTSKYYKFIEIPFQQGTYYSYSIPSFDSTNCYSAQTNIQDTVYWFNISASNELYSSNWTSKQAIATCTSIRDLVKANLTSKEEYVESLAAISANIGAITQGAMGSNENIWDLSTFVADDGTQHIKGTFRVGNEDQYIKVTPKIREGTTTVIDGYEISIKSSKLTFTETGLRTEEINTDSLSTGAYIYSDVNKRVRMRLNPDGLILQKNKLKSPTSEDWNKPSNIETVGQIQVNDLGNLTVTNDPYNIPETAHYINDDNMKVYHFDTTVKDENNEDSKNLNLDIDHVVYYTSTSSPFIANSGYYDSRISKGDCTDSHIVAIAKCNGLELGNKVVSVIGDNIEVKETWNSLANEGWGLTTTQLKRNIFVRK